MDAMRLEDWSVGLDVDEKGDLTVVVLERSGALMKMHAIHRHEAGFPHLATPAPKVPKSPLCATGAHDNCMGTKLECGCACHHGFARSNEGIP